MDGKTVVILVPLMLAVFAFIQYFLEKRRDEKIDVVKERLNVFEEKNKWLERQLEDAKACSPDEVALALHQRVGILKAELTDLREDNAAHAEQIKIKETELNQVRTQIKELTEQMERANRLLEESEYLRETFSCPQCGSPLAAMDYHDAGGYTSYECGYLEGSHFSSPCPYDPDFPKFDEYDLQFTHNETRNKWACTAMPATTAARKLTLQMTFGNTEEEAKKQMSRSINSRRGTYRNRNSATRLSVPESAA